MSSPSDDDAGNGAEPAGHAGRTGVGIARQFAGEHARIELIGLAVQVDVAARHKGAQHGCAVVHAGQEQLVDEAVFGLPQGQLATAATGAGTRPGSPGRCAAS